MNLPSNPCSTCGSVLFWKRAGEFTCAKHDPPADPIGEQFYVTKAAMETAKSIVQAASKDSVLDAAAERPTAPCPIDNSEVFWLSNATDLWSCLQHNYPSDKELVAETWNVRTQQRPSIKTGDDMDWNQIAASINDEYGAKLTASEVEVIASNVEKAQSLLTPHSSVTAVRAMTGGLPAAVTIARRMTTAQKGAAKPSSDRDLYGRNRKERE
ncbi:MAG TPA: hypothetical protein VJA46_12165 [Acidimicrobiia bacterium]|nr:hypothetical protein [Acidimicrobiia bacterium]